MESVVFNPKGIKKIVIYGGESSGKTTLGQALSEKLKCPFVPEYGRFLYDFHEQNLLLGDMKLITLTQLYLEYNAMNDAATMSAKYIVCDTSPLTTFWYSQQMFGFAPKIIEDCVKNLDYDYTILCDNDIPFHQDGTRKDSAFRQSGFDWYLKVLKNDVPLVVQGTVDERIEQICKTFNLNF